MPETSPNPLSKEGRDNGFPLIERVKRYLQETPPPQEGFLSREEWQEKLEEQLEDQGRAVLLVIVDIAGGTELSQQGKIAAAKEKIVKQIDAITTMSLATGRTIFSEKNQIGSDEFLFFMKINPADDIEQIIAALQKNFDQARVHLGAALREREVNTTASEMLSAADFALGRAKEANKKDPGNEEFYPKLLTFKMENDELGAFLGSEKIAEEKLEPRSVDYGEKVVVENPVSELKNFMREFMSEEKSLFLTFFSPTNMRQINQERGMAGGDKVLQDLAKILLTATNKKIFKVGTIFIVPESLSEQQIKNLKEKFLRKIAPREIDSELESGELPTTELEN